MNVVLAGRTLGDGLGFRVEECGGRPRGSERFRRLTAVCNVGLNRGPIPGRTAVVRREDVAVLVN